MDIYQEGTGLSVFRMTIVCVKETLIIGFQNQQKAA